MLSILKENETFLISMKKLSWSLSVDILTLYMKDGQLLNNIIYNNI